MGLESAQLIIVLLNKNQISCIKSGNNVSILCLQPYHIESTSSRLITEVKQCRGRLVLGWVTAWEYQLLYTFYMGLESAQLIIVLLNKNQISCIKSGNNVSILCLRPYHIESTSSRLITEVKQCRG